MFAPRSPTAGRAPSTTAERWRSKTIRISAARSWRNFARARGASELLRTGNTFPVAEAPLDFTRRVASHVRHVHLKDYRVQFTDEGYRLVRCAIGDGAVPIAAMLDNLAARGQKLTAVLEPGALEARHVRFLRPEWWKSYPPKAASAFAACLAAARVNRLADDADYRTPWERGEDAAIAGYELAMIRRSAEQHARDRPWTEKGN